MTDGAASCVLAMLHAWLQSRSSNRLTICISQADLCRLSVDDRMDLVRSFAQEIIQEEELKSLFAKKPNPTAYDGFEPSGRMHIAQGVMKALNVNKLAKCGVRFKFWCASIAHIWQFWSPAVQ